jgi:hypothetical protein
MLEERRGAVDTPIWVILIAYAAAILAAPIWSANGRRRFRHQYLRGFRLAG